MPHRANAALVAMPTPEAARAAEVLALTVPGTPAMLRVDTVEFGGDFTQITFEEPRKNGLRQTIWVPTALLTPVPDGGTVLRPQLSVIDGGQA